MTGRPAAPIVLTANLDIDPWTDITPAMFTPSCRDHNRTADIVRVGLLPEGTSDGRATVAFVIRMPDGTLAMAETTLAIFRALAHGVLATPVAQMDGL